MGPRKRAEAGSRASSPRLNGANCAGSRSLPDRRVNETPCGVLGNHVRRPVERPATMPFRAGEHAIHCEHGAAPMLHGPTPTCCHHLPLFHSAEPFDHIRSSSTVPSLGRQLLLRQCRQIGRSLPVTPTGKLMRNSTLPPSSVRRRIEASTKPRIFLRLGKVSHLRCRS